MYDIISQIIGNTSISRSLQNVEKAIEVKYFYNEMNLTQDEIEKIEKTIRFLKHRQTKIDVIEKSVAIALVNIAMSKGINTVVDIDDTDFKVLNQETESIEVTDFIQFVGVSMESSKRERVNNILRAKEGFYGTLSETLDTLLGHKPVFVFSNKDMSLMYYNKASDLIKERNFVELACA